MFSAIWPNVRSLEDFGNRRSCDGATIPIGFSQPSTKLWLTESEMDCGHHLPPGVWIFNRIRRVGGGLRCAKEATHESFAAARHENLAIPGQLSQSGASCHVIPSRSCSKFRAYETEREPEAVVSSIIPRSWFHVFVDGDRVVSCPCPAYKSPTTLPEEYVVTGADVLCVRYVPEFDIVCGFPVFRVFGSDCYDPTRHSLPCLLKVRFGWRRVLYGSLSDRARLIELYSVFCASSRCLVHQPVQRIPRLRVCRVEDSPNHSAGHQHLVDVPYESVETKV